MFANASRSRINKAGGLPPEEVILFDTMSSRSGLSEMSDDSEARLEDKKSKAQKQIFQVWRKML